MKTENATMTEKKKEKRTGSDYNNLTVLKLAIFIQTMNKKKIPPFHLMNSFVLKRIQQNAPLANANRNKQCLSPSYY